MIYSFNYATELGGVRLEANVEIGESDPGDRYTPPSGPEITVENKRVLTDDPKRPYFFHPQIFMVRGNGLNKKRRLLPAPIADEVETWLLDKKSDDIVEEASFDHQCAMDDAAEDRAEARRDYYMEQGL